MRARRRPPRSTCSLGPGLGQHIPSPGFPSSLPHFPPTQMHRHTGPAECETGVLFQEEKPKETH